MKQENLLPTKGKFHAYTHCDGCSRPRQKSDVENTEQHENNNSAIDEPRSANQFGLENEKRAIELKLFPNPNSGEFTVIFPQASGEYLIMDMNGRIMKREFVAINNQTSYFTLPKGLYILKWVNNEEIITKKISVL